MHNSDDKKAITGNIITDIRPWGNFKQFTHNKVSTVKILTVNPNQILSKQSHKKRDELWIMLDKGLRVELDDKVWEPEAGEEIVILRNSKHRLSSLEKVGRVLEISFGHFDEDDIERFDDQYGRD
ncbi:MAG: mannose-6-phosphate isomerase [candidate division Zixibacteria bacterium]|nr:mannose-6-phosphate isomerase [candidate division Zixibacteria bacterium]